MRSRWLGAGAAMLAVAGGTGAAFAGPGSDRALRPSAAAPTTGAAAKPLVWIAASFGEAAADWAHERGPMTLLVESGGPLSDDERKRVERFAVILGRQAE